jgi:hypothetical protein
MHGRWGPGEDAIRFIAIIMASRAFASASAIANSRPEARMETVEMDSIPSATTINSTTSNKVVTKANPFLSRGVGRGVGESAGMRSAAWLGNHHSRCFRQPILVRPIKLGKPATIGLQS